MASKLKFLWYFFGFGDAVPYAEYTPEKKKKGDKGKKESCAACANADWVPHSCKQHDGVLKVGERLVK